MKKIPILVPCLFGLIATLFGCATSVHAQCPDVSKHETDLDCPWADAARATEGIDDLSRIRLILDEKIPGFTAQVEKDASVRDLLNLWSLSRNIDESNLQTGIKTVPANIIAFLNSILNVTYNADFTEGHAGLTHTYGYLFSNAYTPYGYKRLRYVAGETEAGFGLPQGLFSGLPSTGTLLSNLTTFAAPIAFRDSPVAKGELQDVVDSGLLTIPSDIASYNYSNLKVKRLVEIVANEKYYLEMRTDIVNFPFENTHGNNRALLIYSIDFRSPEQPARPRLVTVFPVDAGFATGLFNPTSLGTSVSMKLKYNAVLPVSIPAEEMVGKRFILNDSTSN
jgi:hypothetical protein